jgi:N-methylhydantoinase A
LTYTRAVPPYRLGIDIGGTFTDFSLLDDATGELVGLKSPSIPADPARGVLDGLQVLLAERGIEPGDIAYLAHGSTIAVNTVIQRNGARLGLLVTRGFGDVLELQRLRLPYPVTFTASRPAPLIPRHRVAEVTERILATGAVDTPLDADGLRAEARRLVESEGCEGLVIAFLNAYRSPRHEALAKALLADCHPTVPVTASHEVWPQIREYERTLVAILSAYVRPRVAGYLERLEAGLREAGVRAPLHITKSNGGVTTARDARRATAETLLSGPASGVIGAAYTCRLAGYEDLLTLDMGGTSADIALVRSGQPGASTEEVVGDFPIVMPAVGVSSIGAGGGSVAWLDAAGVLKVGPRSAGADPGPACYGRGGREATLSDAFLVCGFLDADHFAGGRLKLDPAAAARALTPLGTALGLDVERTAEAIVEVAVANMYAAASGVLARHGADPRDLSLVAFGGAGPIAACFLARELHLARVIVPPAPGTLCALGALTADVRRDDVRTIHRRLGAASTEALVAAARDLAGRAQRWLAEDAPPVLSHALAVSADLRYVGQAFQIEVPLDPAWLAEPGLGRLREAFHERHQHLYAHADRTADVELIDLRATVVGLTPKPALRRPDRGSGTARPGGRRSIRYRGAGHPAGIHRRQDLLAGQEVPGPAVVLQDDTTTFVPPGFRADVDDWGNLVMTRA